MDGVTLLTDPAVEAWGVNFCFTERGGGVSDAPYASLNLDVYVGDDPRSVAENRRRVLTAMGAPRDVTPLCPLQVHGNDVICLTRRDEVPATGQLPDCDAVVCTVPLVPVMLRFADCVPVVIAGPGGFAVAHSGWRGTIARIAGIAAARLADALGVEPCDLMAYVGPHIGVASYEVSDELASRFTREFGSHVVGEGNHLDLGAAVQDALADAGVPRECVYDCGLDTATLTNRFFSHRAEGGKTGRHAACAFLTGGATGR